MSSGPANSRPPALTTTVCPVWLAPLSPYQLHVSPETVASTMAMGMIVKIRSPVVSRLSGRSGYSTSTWTGYASGMGPR
jgi:hypothetical protein